MKGIAGVNDFRELHSMIEGGSAEAKLAYDVYIHRLRRYIGAYMIDLGRVDAITFTAGVGENDSQTRADALAGLENFGVKLDEAKNAERGGARIISAEDSATKVLVVPTNEELAISRHALQFAK